MAFYMMLDQAPADIIGTGIMPELVQSVSCADQQTAELAMRLLHNLSFHEKGRKAMVSAGAIPKVNSLAAHNFDSEPPLAN